MINKRILEALEKYLISEERIHVHGKTSDIYASGTVKEIDTEEDYVFIVDRDKMEHHLLISQIASIKTDE